MVDGERHESPLVTVLGGAPSCVYPRRRLPEELCFFFYQFPRATAFCEPNRSACVLGAHSATACSKGRRSLVRSRWTPTVFKAKMPSAPPQARPAPPSLEFNQSPSVLPRGRSWTTLIGLAPPTSASTPPSI